MKFPKTQIKDDFNRPNEDPLTGWVNVGGANFEIISNRAGGRNTGMLYNVVQPHPDQDVWLQLVTDPVDTAQVALMLRMSTPSSRNGYEIWFTHNASANGHYDLGYRTSGVWTPISVSNSMGAEIAQNDKFGARVKGNVIEVWWYRASQSIWQRLGTHTDSTYSDGDYVGVHLTNSTYFMDDFGGGSIDYLYLSVDEAAPSDADYIYNADPNKTNYVLNPDIEVNTNNWFGIQASETTARTTSHQLTGVAALSVVTPGSVVDEGTWALCNTGARDAGTKLIAGVWIKGTAADTLEMRLGTIPIGGGVYNALSPGLTRTLVNGSWVYFEEEWVPGVTFEGVHILLSNPNATAITFYVDDASLVVLPIARMKLGTLQTPDGDDGHILRWRIRKVAL